MKFFKLHENAQVPAFATEGSACFDLRVCFDENTKIRAFSPHNKEMQIPTRRTSTGVGFQLQPQFRALMPTGLIAAIPTGKLLKVYIRSSMAVKHGVVLANQVGIIDSDYTEELYLPLYNTGDTPVWLMSDERVAQGMLENTITYTLEEAKRRPYNTTARTGGIGSTGTN